MDLEARQHGTSVASDQVPSHAQIHPNVYQTGCLSPIQMSKCCNGETSKMYLVPQFAPLSTGHLGLSKCLHVATISHQLQGIPLTSAQGAPVTLCQSPTNQNSQYRMQGKTDKKSKQYAKQGSAKAETNWVNNVQLVSAKLSIVVQLLKTPGRQCCQSTSCRSTGAVLCNSVSSGTTVVSQHSVYLKNPPLSKWKEGGVVEGEWIRSVVRGLTAERWRCPSRCTPVSS